MGKKMSHMNGDWDKSQIIRQKHTTIIIEAMARNRNPSNEFMKEIQNPIIIGDSTIIIEAMARNKNRSNDFMNKIFRRNKKNLEGSGNVIYRHVLRIHN